MKAQVPVLVLILLLGLVLRVYPAIHYPGTFMEPDVYIYYSVVIQTLAHNMVITSQLSGVPPRPYGEFPGLVLVPAYLSKFTGIAPSLLIEYLPVIMGLLGILVVYLLAYEFMHSHWMAMFAAFLYAVLPAVLYRSIAGEYRGEVFVPVFLAIIMLLLIKTEKKNAIWTIPSIIALLALSIWFWSGGVYTLVAPAIYIFSAIVFFLLPKVSKKAAVNPLFKNRLTYVIVIISLVIAYPIALHVIKYLQNLIGGYISFQTSYIAELAPTSVGWMLEYYGWVFIAAILGLGIIIYFDKKEAFHKSQFALFAMFIPAMAMTSIAVRWLILSAVPACIYGAYLVYALLTIFPISKRAALITIMSLAAIAIMLGFYFILLFAPADYINPQFLSALSWLKSNTPSNATILTMWPDGSVVEGYADRESYTDSIMGLNSRIIIPFERFLYARAGNYTYLKSVDPSYLLVRHTWKLETVGILIEAGYPLNTSYNGTNLQQLMNGTAPFPIVYQNSDAIIYKIKGV